MYHREAISQRWQLSLKAMSGYTGGKLMTATYQASVSLSLPLRPELPLLLCRCESCGQSSESSQSHVALMLGLPGIPASASKEVPSRNRKSGPGPVPLFTKYSRSAATGQMHWSILPTHTVTPLPKGIILQLTQMNKHNPGVIP